MDLCTFCRSLSLHKISRAPDQTISQQLLRAEKAAQEGCAFCSFICQELQPNAVGLAIHPSRCWVRMAIPAGHVPAVRTKPGLHLYELEIYLADSTLKTATENRSESVFLGIAADPNSPAARSGDVIGRYHGDDPSSSFQVSAILEWLSECLEHPECNTTASGTSKIDARDVLLPARCIDTMEKHVSLRNTTGLRGTYITLSHRWSEETKESMTTSVNVDRRINGCDLGSLPKMYDDAISIARSLGVRYLWIDSLCIIQSGDEGADWLREAAKMSSYYQQAIMTLCAPYGTASQGMLSPRRDGSFQSITRFPYRNGKNGQEGHFYLYQPRCRAVQVYDREVLRSELRSRGWVFQEWLLSRRIVYYTPHELFFECQTGVPRNGRQQRICSKRDYGVDLRMRFRAPGFDQWYRLVELYSKTVLTRPGKDHVVALAGIAHEFREVMKANAQTTHGLRTEYLSGLWLEDLSYGLLWQTTRQKQRLCSCRAPSWSWASQLGEVKWLPRSGKMTTKLRVVDSDQTRGNRRLPTEDIEISDILNRSSEGDEIDLIAMCAYIRVTGRLHFVLINNNSDVADNGVRYRKNIDYDTIETLARETGVEFPKASGLWAKNKDYQRACDWRFVCSSSITDVIGGWALFESPHLVASLNSYDGFSTPALLVGCRSRIASGTGGRVTMYHDVYDVLFLEIQENNAYRRIGLGRIFDRHLQREFDSAEERELMLV